jgi:hypothetical protein
MRKNLKERGCLGDLGIYGRTMFRRYLREVECECAD